MPSNSSSLYTSIILLDMPIIPGNPPCPSLVTAILDATVGSDQDSASVLAPTT